MNKAFSKFVVALLIASVFAFSVGSGTALAGTAPTPSQPSGTITTRAPFFQWSAVGGANKYQIQVVEGSTVVYTKTVGLEMCGLSTCGYSPTNLLSYATYKWRVKAQASGVWGSYSAYLSFKIINDPTIPLGHGHGYDADL